MLTEYEVQKLHYDMNRELNAAPGIVIKCAVMLLLIIGLAWIGGDIDSSARGDSPSPATPSMVKAEPYSRTVFEERRQRYIEAYPDSRLARDDATRKSRDASSDGGYFAYQNE